jgi:hypothetical protein
MLLSIERLSKASGNVVRWSEMPKQQVNILQQLQTNTAGRRAPNFDLCRNELADFRVHALPNTNPMQMNVTVSDFTNTLGKRQT